MMASMAKKREHDNRPHKPISYPGKTHFTKGLPLTDERKAEYVEELRKTGRATMARVKVGICGSTILAHRKKDEAFDKACIEAKELFCEEQIEAEIYRRGIEGVDEPVFGSQGPNAGTGVVGWVKKYDSRLLLEFAKRHMRKEYGTTHSNVEQRTEHSGEVRQGIGLDSLSKDSREDLRRILEREAQTDDGSTEAADSE